MRMTILAAALLAADCSGVSSEFSQNPTCYALHGDDERHCMGEMFQAMHDRLDAAEAAAKEKQAERQPKIDALKNDPKWGKYFHQPPSIEEIDAKMAADEAYYQQQRAVNDAIEDVTLCQGMPDATSAWLCTKGLQGN
jgi:hypothetical protein